MNPDALEIALQARKPIACGQAEECRELLEVEMLLSRDERETWPGSTRQKCIRLLGPELTSFLRTRQPEWGNMLGADILSEQPDDLLAALEKRQRDMEIEELIQDIRHAQPMPRKWR